MPRVTTPRHRATVDALLRAVLDSGGDTDSIERTAAFRGEPSAGALGDYTAKVRSSSFRVTDSDIARLREAGFSEDAILEITLAAAVGAAVAILDAGLRTLGSG